MGNNRMDKLEERYATYRALADQAQQKLNRVQQQIYRTGTLRLLLFVAGMAGLIYFRQEGWMVLTGIVLATLLPFVLLMKYHNRLFYRKAYLEKEVEVNRQELAALDYDTSAFDAGNEFVDPSHLYAYDLDIFGQHSLFQYLNRTATEPGRKRLAAWLGKHLEEKEEIIARQKAIHELASERNFRQQFRIIGLLHKGKAADETELGKWAQSPSHFRNRMVLRTLPIAAMGINAGCGILVASGVINGTVWGAIWSCILLASFGFTKRISKMQAVYGKKLQVLGTYAHLLQLMDEQPMQAPLLKKVKEAIGGSGRKASAAIRQLNKLMNELDQRNNYLIYALLNGTFFWELWQIMHIEAWKEQYAVDLPYWLAAIGETDALCSLATFDYNHPEYCYPQVTDTRATIASSDKGDCNPTGAPAFCLKGKALGHPLMHRDRCVRNDIDIQQRPYFLIITGANMAGKSTYLRTIGINYLLACVGAPVCAHSMEFTPARLVTSLRTSDSLNDNESYFFAELKRLKLIIDKLQAGESPFIILDEILKGTNSVDKQKGSFALIEQFMALQADGIIATHDLLLGKLIELFPGHIRNYCFEADIRNDELTFSYRLRPGIAQNMNACFLMKKMGIAVAD